MTEGPLTTPLAIGFPNMNQWPPDPHQVKTSGSIIQQVCGAVLDQTPNDAGGTRGDAYVRRVLTTGQTVPMTPQLDGQLVVSVFEMALGRAGEQRFQFYKGTLGTYAQRFVRFQVQLARTSPVITGGIAPRLQTADDLVDFADELWTDAWMVWSALLAMTLGGVKDLSTGEVLSPGPLTQDNVLVGPVAFDPPGGGLAVAKIEVQVQM